VILILSDPNGDAHVPPVTTELLRRGANFHIYDPATFPNSSSVTFRSRKNGVQAILSWNGQDLDLDDVTSIWYRRPGDFALSDHLLAEEKDWIRTECSHLIRSIWQNTRALWVSNPDAIRRASLKGLQLRLAIEMGFQVPQFIVTNDVDQATAFIASFPSGVIVKVLSSPAIRSGDRVATIYTHLVSDNDMRYLSAVKFGPTFLQEFIHKAMDVRVTVIGDTLYAIGIHSTEASRVDFRQTEVYNLAHTVLTLPHALHDLCIRLVKELGLTFGAIDLILTPGGEYHFLEINPNGQWLWLEYVTGIPLAKTMCDLLSHSMD
jgi:glutathione synthase/RimK-type ligase-like ATP-grasp enzyme